MNNDTVHKEKKNYARPVAHTTRSLSQFLQHEAIRGISSSPWNDTSSSEVYPQHYICQYKLIHLREETL